MPVPITLESVGAGEAVEILQVAYGSITVGREPENNIVVDSPSVSRVHGSITEAGSQWVFRDHGSTNGSFINEVQLASGQMKLLRDGDVIRFADFPIRVNEHAEQATDSGAFVESSILVFFGDKFKFEFAFSPEAPQFVVGGQSASLHIDGEPVDIVQFAITKNEQQIDLAANSPTTAIVVNGVAVGGIVSVVDGDVIGVGAYHLIINDKASRAVDVAVPQAVAVAPEVSDVGIYSQNNLPDHLKKPPTGVNEWESEVAKRRAKSGRSFLFDQEPEGDPELGRTMRVEAAQLGTKSAYEISSSQRFNMPGRTHGNDYQENARLAEKMIMVFGAITILLGFGLIAYLLSI